MKTISFLNKGVLYSCLVMMLLLASCSRESQDIYCGSESGFVLTRSGADERFQSFRMMAYNTATLALVNTGTYIKDYYNGATILLQHRVNDDGSIPSDDKENDKKAGLNLGGSYNVLCVSPGVKNTGSWFEFNPAADPFYSSAREVLTLGKYGLHTLTNPLEDQRAKVSFKIFKNSNHDEALMIDNDDPESFLLYGAGAYGQTIKYYPAQRQFEHGNEPMHIVMNEVQSVRDMDNDEWNAVYQSSGNFLPSAFYCKRDEIKEKLNRDDMSSFLESDYLYVTFKIKQGDKDPVRITKILTDKLLSLEAHTEYSFNFYIKSEMVSLILQIHSIGGTQIGWEEEPRANNTIDSRETKVLTIDLGTWNINDKGGIDWNEISVGEQKI